MKSCPREIERSHVVDGALDSAGHAGWNRHKRKHIVKNRFRTPYVKLVSRGGKSQRSGTWPCGHRHNNHHK
jgi:hypothetical protein